MKRCPTCNRVAVDPALVFCRADGTRLIAEPDDSEPTAILPTQSSSAELINVQLLDIPSIAVLPFVNMSADPENEYFCDGLAEELLNALAKIDGVKVAARTSSFAFKGQNKNISEIGRALGAATILEGSVRKSGNRVRITVQLVNTADGYHLWSERYDRKMNDIFDVQDEITHEILEKLLVRLSTEQRQRLTKRQTENPEAYQAYLKGRYYWNRRTGEDLKKGIEQFKLAADLDPNYAFAYSGLADCYALLTDYLGTPANETGSQAKAFAERAIALDDQLAEPHATLGIVNMQLFQWAEAEREAKRAVELNPNYPTGLQWYGSILLDTGKYDEAAAVIKRASELDPLSGAISNALTNIYQVQKNYLACIKNSLKFIELDRTFAASYRDLGFAYVKVNRMEEAVAALEEAVELGDRASWVLGDLGYVYAIAGKRTEALTVLKELESMYEAKQAAGRYVAAVFAGLGLKDKVMEWLEKDLVTKNGRLIEIRWTIPFESLQNDPRFLDLLRRMGVTL